METKENLLSLRAEIANFDSHISTLQKARNQFMTELRNLCPHEVRNTHIVHRSGGYDYRGETQYYYTCDLCGDVQTEIVEHSF